LRPRVRRASAGGGGAHSLRARAGAVGALLIVAIAVWGVVMLIQHFGGSKASNRPPVAAAPEVKVVIPEGESRLQIAAIAHKDGLTGNYMRASTRSQALQPERFGAPASIPSLEGFLFPATYKMPVHGNAKGLVERQLEAFQERFGSEEQKHARALGLTSYQLLIVASMIEREAYLASDRPKVAAVIYNRLRQGIPLGIDSTIRFALNDYTRPLTEAQLQTPSPYNTRLHKGLPPTPISNPGMEAIEAAAHPAHVGYLFYVDGADGCGDLVFSDTEAEFEADKAAYNQALATNGGHTPACKHK
ncbi:MAG: endolytic transglycosylase MltG, partial [Solirubrobacteraceae bacterium]